MSTSSGAIVNPYKRMLLKRESDSSGSESVIKVPGITTEEEVVEETSTDLAVDGTEYKDGLTDEQKADVDKTLGNIESTEPTYKLEEKNQGILKGISEKTKSILNQILSRSKGNMMITSGLRSIEENTAIKGNPNSFHLSGDAADLRPSETLNTFFTSVEGLQYLADQGYEVVDEREREGYAPHWHLEPAPQRKFLKGGLIYRKNG